MKILDLKTISISICILLLSINLKSQTISLYQKTYTSGLNEIGNFAGPANDGGLIVAGYTNVGGNDALVIKLNPDGDVDWAYTYSGTGTQIANVARPTSDGGYIVVGYNASADNYSSRDVLLMKLNSDGTLDWAKTYGTDNSDAGYDVVVANDGGFAVVGETNKVIGSGGGMLFIKTDASGNVSSYNQYRDDSGEIGKSIAKTSDGGYIVANDDLSDYVNFMKLTSTGIISWSKSSVATGVFGSPSVWQVIQTSDGGYAAAAHMADVSFSDAAVVKVNSSGVVEWWERIGNPTVSSAEDWAFGIQQYGDELIVSGYTNNGGPSAYVFKMDMDGNLLSSDIISSANRFGMYLSPGGDGGYALATQKGSALMTIKMNSEVFSGCSNTDAGLSVLGDTYLEDDAPTTFEVTTAPTPADANLTATPYSPTISTPCEGLPVEEISINEDIIIYPNPASENIFISLNNNVTESPVLITIINSQGQIISSFNLNNMKTFSIKTSSLQDGLYFLQVSFGDQFLKKKFILENN